jgi:hypothetical protein
MSRAGLDTGIGKDCKDAVAAGARMDRNALIENHPISTGTSVACARSTGCIAGGMPEAAGKSVRSGSSSLQKRLESPNNSNRE